MKRLALLAFVSSVTMTLTGCPPKDKEHAPPAPTTIDGCTKVGQSCEVSKGKLGTCVAKDDCPAGGPSCFVCQSQH